MILYIYNYITSTVGIAILDMILEMLSVQDLYTSVGTPVFNCTGFSQLHCCLLPVVPGLLNMTRWMHIIPYTCSLCVYIMHGFLKQYMLQQQPCDSLQSYF